VSASTLRARFPPTAHLRGLDKEKNRGTFKPGMPRYIRTEQQVQTDTPMSCISLSRRTLLAPVVQLGSNACSDACTTTQRIASHSGIANQPGTGRVHSRGGGGGMQHSSRGARRVGRQPRPGGVRRATQQPGSFGGSIGRCGAPSSAATHSADDAHAILSSWWGRARARAIGGGFESISLAASSRARRRRHPVRAHVTQVRPFPPLRIATYGGEATRRPWPKT
jgi:hypothetical protein